MEKLETLKKVKTEEAKPIKKKFVWWAERGTRLNAKVLRRLSYASYNKVLDIRIKKWIASLIKTDG
jgi:hypothetical protein